MVGVNGGKFPAIRQHLAENIGAIYKDMDLRSTDSHYLRDLIVVCSFEEFPKNGKIDPEACMMQALYESLVIKTFVP